MKRIFLSAIFVLLICLLPRGSFAQGRLPTIPPQATAAPLPTIFVPISSPTLAPQPTCGIAGSSTANQCCGTNKTTEALVEEEFEGATTAMQIQGTFGNILKSVVSLLFTNGGPDYFDALITKCYNGIPDPNAPAGTCTCVIPTTPVINPDMVKLCDKFVKPFDGSVGNLQVPINTNDPAYRNRLAEYNKCVACAQGQAVGGRENAGYGGYYSAIGCIQPDLGDFISNFVLRIGIGIAGVVAIACIIYSSIILQTSRGDAEAIQKARDQITSCIIGLIMIIFSVFILRLIGVDILRIPGFS